MTALTAADPELHQHYSTAAYGLGIVRFLILGALLLAACALICSWTAKWVVTRAVSRALDRGDAQIRTAVEEAEDAYTRRRQQHAPVPKQLQGDRG